MSVHCKLCGSSCLTLYVVQSQLLQAWCRTGWQGHILGTSRCVCSVSTKQQHVRIDEDTSCLISQRKSKACVCRPTLG